jgi:molybdopterin adenylyltransferase
MPTAAVITVSDGVVAGTRQDTGGPAVIELLEKNGFTVVKREVVPDERTYIENTLMKMCDTAELVVTTGGTGLAPRDVTPEATLAVCDRTVPGLAELMRTEGLKTTQFAPLSRSVCGTRGRSLILNLPGNPKGAVESLQAVLHLIPHALDLLAGKTAHK